MRFPVSGVECSPLLPPAVGFLISVVTASAGVSGACLLLPFQVSVLGFVSPAVSPTNLIFNVIATPGGIYRYFKEGRMAWPLAWVLIAGTLPGMFLGAVARVRWLPDPRSFKAFVGCVLLYLGARLLYEFARHRQPSVPRPPRGAVVRTVSLSLARIEFEFSKERFSFKPVTLVALALVVGMVGGIYGIGGGALIAPFLVAVLGLPIYTVAGAALLSTLMTSAAGVLFFELLGLSAQPGAPPVRPDWALGALFGIGGLLGTYAGARLQKFVPERWIRLVLGTLIAGLAAGYIGQFLFP